MVCTGTLLAVAVGLLDIGLTDMELEAVVSLRMGMAMIAVAPLMVSAMNASRERMLKALHHTCRCVRPSL